MDGLAKPTKGLNRADSVKEVLVSYTKLFLDGRKLSSESTIAPDGVTYEYTWPGKDSGSLVDVVEKLLVGMVRELSGQTKILVGADEKHQEIISFEQPFPRRELMSFLEDATKRTFSNAGFSDSANTGILLELTYRMSVAQFINPTFISKFPKAMCRHSLGTSDRNDLVIRGQSILSLYTKKEGDSPPGCLCVFNMQALSQLFSEIRDVQQAARYLPKEWTRLSECKADDVPDLLEQVKDSLHTLWQGTGRKSQKKVLYLMNVVGTDLIKFIQVASAEVWKGPYFPVKSSLESCVVICQKWAATTTELTTKLWSEEWTGGAYEDAGLTATAKRLEEIIRVRSTIEQTISLLGGGDQGEADFATFAKIFEDVEMFGPYSQQPWSKALAQFEQFVTNLEPRLITKLRTLLAGINSASALRNAFRGYKELCRRPAVQKALANERELFMGALMDMLHKVRSAFDKKDTSASNGGVAKQFNSKVQNIMWVRHLKQTVEYITDSATALVSDVGNYDSLKSTAGTLHSAMDSFERDCFSSWKNHVIQLVKEIEEPLTVHLTGNMLQRKDGKVVVTYDDRQFPFICEVRQLQALGLNVPTDIQVFAAKAARFHTQALNLKHIASFYNALDVQILKCHRMVLNDLVTQFETAAVPSSKEKKRFTWSGGADAELYAGKISKIALQLSSENRRLRRVHTDMAERTNMLMNVDLLKMADRWKSTLKDMREKFAGFERSYHRAGVEVWKRHWDCQLYKALEHQYQYGLETLNENLQELQCSLVFNQGMLQFRPMLETIREMYYQKMKEFISIPLRFRGMANSDFFQLMPEKNEKAVAQVYATAESVFARLAKLKRRFKEWVVLGTVDLEPFVCEHLTTLEDWKYTYDQVKEKQKALEKVEDVVRIDCITVSLAPVKTAAEDLLVRLLDSIQQAIRVAAQGDIHLVETFLETAMQKLSLRPTSLDDISAANEAYVEINAQRADLQARFDKFDAKNKMLRSMGFPPVDLTTVSTKWDRFMQALEAHEKTIDTQLGKMRATVEQNIAKFMKEVSRFAQHWNDTKPKDISSYATKQDIAVKCVDFMKEKRTELDDLKSRSFEIRRQCEYFKISMPDFTEMDEMETDFVLAEEMWNFYEAFEKDLGELTKEDWLTFRSKAYRFDDFVKEWMAKIKEQPVNHVTQMLRKQCEMWSEVVPTLKFLRGEGMTPDHWATMFKILELEKGMTAEKLHFGHIVDKAKIILEKLDEIKALHMRAQGEIQIREALQELRTWGNDCCFQTFVRAEGGRNIHLVKDWKDITTAVSDNQSLLGSLKDSPYFSFFADEAQAWEQKLTFLDQCLPNLNLIQRKWLYLEPIFSRGALPAEQGRFRRVDKEFVSIMKDIQQDPRVANLAKKPELETTLPQCLEQLDRCQKALNEFLEEKRDRFPRFYFIGDDDMLEILGQAQNPAVIQSHLKKLFAGISRVEFSESMKEIVAMLSVAGEVVPLDAAVVIKPEVDMWLGDLDVRMRATLAAMLVESMEKFDVAKFPSQVLCLREMVWFTKEAEKHITAGSLANFKSQLQKKLVEFTQIESSISKVLELKTKALILDLIHNIEVCSVMMEAKCNQLDDWLWQKQLRLYIDSQKACVIRMVDAQFQYTYEYQGNAPRLVHTPLTDKCYLTLTQGMHLGYGGNPYGPAGTGKTESVKALGNAMGRQVLVFNCDEGIDFKSMGRIFMGLCKCGAWGCFDEFNRLKEDQLSAISDMIQVIQAALKARDERVFLLGRNVDLNPSAGIFVTMNPAGKNYGGRSKLPENLKLLFRAVAMTVPDTGLICEVELYSEGFVEARALGKKLVEAFNLCRDLLSQQQHYDWGLRALKMILKTAGSMKHAEARVAIQASMSPPGSPLSPQKKADMDVFKSECEIVMKASRVNTLSKLTFEDAVRFNEIMADVFPGIGVVDISNDELAEAVRATMGSMKLQVIDTQIHKIMQLNEAMLQRMGVCVVGPSGSGKSTLIQCLQKAYTRLGKAIPMRVMNPKAMPRQQLLGYMDVDTREWNDGVLTMAARKVMEEPVGVRSWIVCDGDIDPEWVESLNSVLDDNRLLTMPSGERIQFGDNVNFIFETHSLAFASPATVSRMSVIFLSEEDVDPHSAVKSWLANNVPAERQPQLSDWISKFFYKAVEMLVATHNLVVETTQMGIVMSGLSQLHDCTNPGEFALGLIRGLGSYLSKEHRAAFATDIFKLCGQTPADSRRPLDSYWDPETNGFVNYQATQRLNLTVEDLQNNVMIDTLDVQRNLDICKGWVGRKPFLLVGPEGCGKSMLIQNLFKAQKNTKIATINCSAQTNCNHVIQKLNQMCTAWNTPNGRVLRPKDCDRLVLFLKDLNLPKPDIYATTQLHAFLQQLILYNGYYASNLEWIGVQNIQIVASMNPQGGVGRYPLVTRFTAITCICSVSYPDRDQLQMVYSEYLHAIVSSPALESQSKWTGSSQVREIASVMVSVYESVKKRYNVDEKSHYIFTPRDLTHWTANLLNYDLSQNNLLDVIAYEGQRIFSDRLVSTDHRSRFDRILIEELVKLGYDGKKGDVKYYVSFLATAAEQMKKDEKKDSKKDKKDKDDDSKKEGKEKKEGERRRRTLRQLTNVSRADLMAVLERGLVTYAREFRKLDLMMIDETILWICRTDRILSQPGGSLLFSGRPGVGRRNIASLVAYMLRMVMYTLNMSKDYGIRQFKAELKTIMQTAGINNEEVCLVIEDHNLVQPEFIEMINSLLSSGEIPGLYTPEELNLLLAPLQEECQAEGFFGGPYNFFIDRIQKNVHVVLLFDPVGPDYELRCQSNPAIYTRCGILWIDQWSQEGMRQIPRIVAQDLFEGFTKDLKQKAEGDEAKLKELTLQAEKKQNALQENLLFLHRSMGNAGTPRGYVQFLKAYARTFTQQHKEVSDHRNRLRSGLSKLREAEANVDVMAKDAAEQKKTLTLKQEQADRALEEIQASMEQAGEQKKDAEELRTQLGVESKELESRKAEIEKQLSAVQPMLEEAKKAVGSIKAENLNEIKALKMPPEAIRDVLEGVLAIMGIHDTSWVNMKKFLGQRGMIQDILNFDAHNITSEARQLVKNLIASKANSFKPEVITRASVAAAPLAAWATANLEYSIVLEKVGPLEADLAKLQAGLEKSTEKLKNTEERIKELDAKVSEIKKKFKKLTAEAEKLRVGLENAEATLAGATELLGKLVGEKSRWEEQVKDLDAQLSELGNLAMLSAAYMTYIASEDEDKRRQMLTEWKQRLGVTHYVFKDFMRTESMLLAYKSEGLPADDLSIENGVVILESQQTCLIIDPAQQAIKWLKTHLQKGSVTVENTTATDDRFQTTLELAVRFGKTLIISEVDRVEPVLYPILRGDIMANGPKSTVLIGEKHVDWQDNFRLYLVTRNPNLVLAPDAKALVTLVNFAITRSGLEGQLLGLTLQHEKPELESQKSTLLRQEEEYKLQLAELEEKLLKQLASSEGSLLENKALIDALNQIKESAVIVKKSLEESKVLQESLDKQREEYRPFAKLGSTIFFLVQDLSTISHMYQFALASYIKLFMKTLEVHKNTDEAAQKIPQLNRTLISSAYFYVARSLFKQDRLLFGLHMCFGVYPDQFPEAEWQHFGSLGVFVADLKDTSHPSWVDTDTLAAFQALKRGLPDLFSKLEIREDTSTAWQSWLRQPAPENSLNSVIKQELTPFQQNLVIGTFRPDRLPISLQHLACKLLELDSLTPPAVNMAKIAKDEASASEPVLMITTPGADPSQEWEEVAIKVAGHDRFTQLAMGGGQTDEAIALLKRAAHDGGWLLLKNLHLVVAWVDTLEKEFTNLQPHENFRLWLTTEPHDSFPGILLRTSLKITFQSPPGIKKNLLRTYDMWPPEFIEQGSVVRARILFVLAFFHAILMERRTFIPQGWVKFYEFSVADLKTAAEIISAQCTAHGVPNWPGVYGLLENAIYGGRMDNDYDIRILMTYLHKYFNNAMVGASGSGKAITMSEGGQLAKGIGVPNSNKHADFLEMSKKLPNVDNPDVFGLPPNADRLVQKSVAMKAISNLKRLKDLQAGVSGTFNRELWAATFKPLFELWDGLVGSNKAIMERKSLPKKEMSPITAFIHLEAYTAFKLVTMVDEVFSEVQRVVAGSTLLTQQLQTVAKFLMSGAVPPAWDRAWEGPESIQMWLRYMVQRAISLQDWLKRDTTLLNSPIRLNHCFRPITMLNALRQETARKSGQPLDYLVLDCAWGDSATIPSAAMTATIEGLLLTGANFDPSSHTLKELQSDSPGFAQVPRCKVGWVVPVKDPKEGKKAAPQPPSSSGTVVEVPCYFSSTREKLLAPFNMPIGNLNEREKWVLSGVALVLEP